MKHKLGIICFTLGTVLIITALSLLLWNNAENKKAEKAVKAVMPELQTAIINNSKDDVTDLLTAKVNDEEYIGYLTIPELSLELPVMKDFSYKRLKSVPCRFYGSVYTNDLVIAAHNYNRHFGNIDKLNIGSEIYFTDALGNTVRYAVAEIEVLAADDTDKMINSDYALSLFTCTYSGEKRVTVRCERI